MADTRNDIYAGRENSTSPPCDSQESPHKIVIMKVNTAESSGTESRNVDSEEHKPFQSSRSFSSPKSESPVHSSRFGSSFGSKPFVLRQSAFGSPKFSGGSPVSSSLSGSPKHVVLRPSQLAVANAETQSPTVHSSSLQEPKLPVAGNLFQRVPAICEDSLSVPVLNDEKKEVSEDQCSDDSENIEQKPPSDAPCTKATATNKVLTSPKFVPLGTPASQKDESSSGAVASSSSSSSTNSSSTKMSGFVFGQNLHERVEVVKPDIPEPKSSEAFHNAPGASAATNGTSEMLFTSVIRKELPTEGSNSNSSNEGGERPSKSLSEAAREYEEARAVKRKYEEVTVVTGEEDEANVLQLNCKLFAFDKGTGTWMERGRGTLRLNDKDSSEGLQSRIVIRTTGSLRVVLNTKIWGGMVVDHSSAKSVRLTAMDNSGQIKVFLVMASPKEIEQLHHALTSRVVRKQQAELTSGINSQEKMNDGCATQIPSCSSSLEPSKKRPSLLQDTGGGSEPKV